MTGMSLPARMMVGGLFAYAGFMKLVYPVENFHAVLAEYPLVPHAAIPLIALTLPWAELVLGVFLVTGYLTRLSAAALLGLCAAFVLLLVTRYMIEGTLPADCGCFGTGWLHFSGAQILAMDVVNAGLCVLILRCRKYFLSLDSWLGR